MTYVYFGSDPFALAVLEGLSFIHSPIAVVTQPDRASGRKMKIQKGPLSKWATANNIPLFQPPTLKDIEHADPIINLQADLFIVVSFGQILTREFIERSPALLNGHASMLPRYRGASPIQSVLLNGEAQTGMCIMHIVEALDAGPVVSSESITIEPQDDFRSLSQKLIRSAIEQFSPFIQGAPVPEGSEQNHEQATFCGKLNKKILELNPLNNNAQQLWNKIRAFSPKPGAYLNLYSDPDPIRLKILMAELINDSIEPGKFVAQKNQLLLGCAEGSLSLKRVQLQGKGPVDSASFLNGWRSDLKGFYSETIS